MAEQPCKFCKSAVYDLDCQTGCEKDLLDKEVAIEAYDEQKEFYVIPTECSGYEDVFKPKQFFYDVIVYVKHMEDFKQVEERVLVMNKLEEKPKNVVLLVHSDELPQREHFKILSQLDDIESSMENVMDPDATTMLLAVNYAASRIKSPFFFVLAEEEALNNLDISQIRQMIDVQDKKVAMIKQPLFFRTKVFNYVGGTSKTSVVDKIETIIEEQKSSLIVLDHLYE